MSTGPQFLFRTLGRDATDGDAIEHLTKTVDRLIRAERRQSLMHFGGAGIFWGLITAAAAVLISRLGLATLPVNQTIVLCIVAALAASLGIRWTNRRSPLSVAILGDIRLGLKQQLSSAWELYEQGNRSGAAGIARLLPRTRTADADRVFPLSGKGGHADHIHAGMRWGRLIPAAGLLLVLLSTLDFHQTSGVNGEPSDVAVQREGTTLRNYGESVALRARNKNLTASAKAADAMLRLGRKMEGGTVTREAALKQMDDLRRDINNDQQRLTSTDGNAAGTGTSTSTSNRKKQSARSAARDTIEEAANAVTRGDATPGQLQDDTALQSALVSADINPDAFRKALEQAQDGDPQSLEQILRELRADAQASQDAETLERASKRIQGMRENLGAEPESQTSTQPSGNRNAEPYDNGTPGRDLFDQPPGANGEGSSFVFGDQGRAGNKQSAADTADNPAAATSVNDEQPHVQASGSMTDGPELNTQTRTTPRQRDITTPLHHSDAVQQRQLEAIMSKETLPAHQKDYVRRYFLELSRAVTTDEPPE